MISESKLVLEERNADIDFSGQITEYSVRPMAIQADAVSAETRLTVSVKVRYRNFKDPKQNWESSLVLMKIIQAIWILMMLRMS